MKEEEKKKKKRWVLREYQWR